MNKKNKSIISLCAMSFILLAASATSPALATIADSFPNAPASVVSSIATISNLFGVPFMIVTGVIGGKRAGFRQLAIIGLSLVAVGGLIPFFSTDLIQILLGRAILGIGTGLSNPIISTLTLSLFEADDTAKQFSRNMMSTNVGAVIFQLSGGFLCQAGWRMSFLAYLVVIPVLVIVVFMLPEPERIIRKNGELRFSVSKVLTPHVIFWSTVYALYMMFFYPFVTEISGILATENLGGAMTSALILSIHTGFGVLGGFLFYHINRVIRIFIFSVGFGMCALGYSGLAISSNIASIALSAIVFGTGYGILGPAINYYLGRTLEPEYRAASVATENLFSSIASFLSPFVLASIKNVFDVSFNRLSFIICAAFFVVATLYFVCYAFLLNRNRNKTII